MNGIEKAVRNPPAAAHMSKLAIALYVPLADLVPDSRRTGLKLHPVEGGGAVLAEMALNLPADAAQTVWDIAERRRRWLRRASLTAPATEEG
ncbi:hypothetical protein [Pikeienuella sp. HZG-20]|uniref:hypothetical protein n=1 Tax=Paludibacillus litoralis TaxID=3133267 RepID=UPI0030ECA21A